MKKAKSNIPIFATVEEEAEFWDTHSIADYWEEMTPIKVVYAPEKEKKEVMPIRISPSVKKLIVRTAKNYDISPSSLMRMWIVDKLRQTQKVKYRA